MKPIIKKIVIFIAFFIFFLMLFSVLMNIILPIKTTVLVGKNIGIYNNGDVLFYSESESYIVNDYIVYRSLSKPIDYILKIIEINPNGTFKVTGSNTLPIDELNNTQKEQIKGKIIYSISMYIFYPIVIAICLILAFILTHFVSKKIK